MKKNIITIVFILLLSLASCSFTSNKFSNPNKEEFLLEVVQTAIEEWHYSPSEVNDAFSKKVFKKYLDNLDSQKRYFLQSDIEEFKKSETLLDDQLKNKDLSFFELTYSRVLQRMKESEVIFKEEIKKTFDFSKNESINTDYKNVPYAKNAQALREYWRKILKFSVLSNYIIREKEENTKKEKDAKYKVKSAKEIKKEAIETTQKAFEDLFLSYKDLLRDDWFGIYANCFVEVIDPHTNYMAPDLKERFKSDMSGTFEGIGARLQKRTEGIRIADIIMGGPVWKSKQIEVGDLILKVGQGNDAPVDVVGMRLDEAIKLIKGKKGTQVKLTIKKVDGTIEVVTLTRDIVEVEETFIKSVLVKENNITYGVIEVPKFYTNLDNPKGRNVASDMMSEVEKLKELGVQGLVVDLRNNGGGSLPAVVKIAGLFIEKGPVVQVKNGSGAVQVLEDTNPEIQWNKPVVILVNELSASASEILAAALQDYQRAIVLGGKSTFGKGTVQSVIDIKRDVVSNSTFEDDLGLLKLTIQKFYRINGGSTQLKGVESDIVIPDKYKYVKVGERELENPMAWDKIAPATYKKWSSNVNFTDIISKSNKRIQANENFKLIDENAQWIKKQGDENIYSLNYTAYKKQIENDEEKAKKFKTLSSYKSVLNFSSLPQEEKMVQTDKDFKQRRDRWFENLSKDLYLEEAIFVLKDLLK